MDDRAPADLAAATHAPWRELERAFAAIGATRMAGLPFLNEALRVEAVAFRRWEGRWLGVLITPWFMNLVLLRDEPAAWRPLPVRETCSYALPSGVYDFLGSEEEGVGDFQMCSLFSPMQDFADHDGARAVAQAVMDAIFDPATRSGEHGPDDRTLRADGSAVTGETDPSGTVTDRPASPSKRAFLRGGLRSSP